MIDEAMTLGHIRSTQFSFVDKHIHKLVRFISVMSVEQLYE